MKSPDRASPPRARSQGGYALIALLALMSMLMIAAMAAAPSIRQQSRRERELEAIARGEEVAEAIRAFYHYTSRLPTSMDELKEGAPFGTKKIQVLRASAACDPLTSREGECGEWQSRWDMTQEQTGVWVGEIDHFHVGGPCAPASG